MLSKYVDFPDRYEIDLSANLSFSARFGENFQAKLQLEKPTRLCHSSRIIRKYKSHRFLFIQVQSAQRRHLDNMIAGSSRNPLWICCRKYRFLGVDKCASPQTYVFFAEQGLGISKADEIHVNEVREQCIPRSMNAKLTQSQEDEIMLLNMKNSFYGGILPPGSVEVVKDIDDSSGVNTGTRSCGLVSWSMLNYIWNKYKNGLEKGKKLAEKKVVNDVSEVDESNGQEWHRVKCPSSFQGQVGGFFGMWVLDDALGDDMKLICRKSQMKYIVPMKCCTNLTYNDDVHTKYDAFHETMNIMSWGGEPRLGQLNPRMIQLLEHKGVESSILVKHVKKSKITKLTATATTDANVSKNKVSRH